MHRFVPTVTSSANMICVNASTDSNDSAISYSPPSLSESPVKSLAIQQLLQSPILNHGSQSRINYDSDSDVDVNDNSNDNSNDMMTAATLDTTPDGSQTDPTSATDLPMDVSSSESSDRPNNPEPIAVTPNGGRNTFRRQASVCLNTKIASSPRALAILKNAIKTSLTPNSICDKSEVKSDISKSVSDLSAVKGTHSPPNKSFKSSPLSRGSALLKAAKERLERQESQRSPKISCNLFQMSNESSLDRQLTSILRKRELQSSPTNTDHKAKKKKVLFAEPVVSSQMEFRPSPCHSSLSSDYLTLHPDPATDKEVEELTNQNNDKKRNNLVHQHSTFDKEFDDIAYDFGGHNSPLLFTQDILDEEPVVVPSCEPSLELEPLVDEERLLSSPELLQSSQIHEEVVEEQGSQESYDHFECSQVMPHNNDYYRLSPEMPENSESVAIQTEGCDDSDPIVHIPMRLSLLKELYAVFGNVIRDYASQPSPSPDS